MCGSRQREQLVWSRSSLVSIYITTIQPPILCCGARAALITLFMINIGISGGVAQWLLSISIFSFDFDNLQSASDFSVFHFQPFVHLLISLACPIISQQPIYIASQKLKQKTKTTQIIPIFSIHDLLLFQWLLFLNSLCFQDKTLSCFNLK